LVGGATQRVGGVAIATPGGARAAALLTVLVQGLTGI